MSVFGTNNFKNVQIIKVPIGYTLVQYSRVGSVGVSYLIRKLPHAKESIHFIFIE